MTQTQSNRRDFLQVATAAVVGVGVPAVALAHQTDTELLALVDEWRAANDEHIRLIRICSEIDEARSGRDAVVVSRPCGARGGVHRKRRGDHVPYTAYI